LEDNRLIEGILQDADAEAEKILKEAREQVRIKKAGLERQMEEIRRESLEEREKKLEEIRRRSDSAVKSARRKNALKRREHLHSLVIREAEKLLAERISSPEYPEVLAKWIAEGILGLGCPETRVRCSRKETLTPELLSRAAELVQSVSGKKVVIRAEKEALPEQGVAVTAADGRTSFHNQVSNRFRRYEQEIKKIIYDNLDIAEDPENKE